MTMPRSEPITVYEFAEEYLAGYIRSYLAFRYRQPILIYEKVESNHLYNLATDQQDELALGSR